MPDYDAVARWEWRGDRQSPLSPLHAAERDADETLCGEPTEQMIVTGAWRPGGWGGRCHDCQRLATTAD